MTKEIKKLKLEDRDFTGDYLFTANTAINRFDITVVESGEASSIILSHADARKLAEFILENVEEER